MKFFTSPRPVGEMTFGVMVAIAAGVIGPRASTYRLGLLHGVAPWIVVISRYWQTLYLPAASGLKRKGTPAAFQVLALRSRSLLAWGCTFTPYGDDAR